MPAGLAQTVLGTVQPATLGRTTTHEHLLIEFGCMFIPQSDDGDRIKAQQPVSIENLGWVRYNPFRNHDNLQLSDEDTAISEALLYKEAGGGTIVDATTIGIGRNPQALERIARATGLNVIMGAGYYVDMVHPDTMDEKTEDDLATEMIADIQIGVGDTGVRAGIIGELGCSWPLTNNERKVLRAGAAAHRETGVAILIHPGRNEKAPFEILNVLAEAGADTGRVVMGHIDRTIHDIDIVLELAQQGCYLEYDLFGWEASLYPFSNLDMPNDAQRIAWVKTLLDKGYSDRIVLAHDTFGKHAMTKYGGYGYAHILKNIAPRFREQGVTQADLDSMLIANPASILTIS